MSSDDDIEVTIIYDEAKDCDSWFEKYSEALRERRDEDVRVNLHVEVVQDLRERFWAWTRGIGVYAEPLISLDRRLARHPKIREMVLLLLKLIRDNLQEAIEANHKAETGCGPNEKMTHDTLPAETCAEPKHLLDTFHTKIFNQTFDPEASDVFRSWQIHQKVAQHGIEEALKRLNQLSVAIRQSRQTTPEKKAQKVVERHDASYEDFQKLAAIILNHLYPNINTALRDQLIESITIRRARILIQQSHEKALQAERRTEDMTKHVSPKETPREANQLPTQRATSQNIPVDPGTQRQSRSVPRPLRVTATSDGPTTLDGEALEERINRGSSETEDDGRSTILSTWAGKFQCPPPPEVPNGSKVQNCPLCSRLYTAAEFKTPKWWRRHVANDIQHYACISQDCKFPPRYFSSSVKWENHMRREHGQNWLRDIHPKYAWCCLMDHNNPTTFSSSEEHLQHFKEQHPVQYRSLRGEDFRLIADSSRVPLPRRIDACPICDTTANMLPSSDNESGYDQGALLGQAETIKRISRHIADHLMVLASISLHDIALKNDDSSETSNVSQELHWENHKDMQSETTSHLSFVSDPYAEERMQYAPMEKAHGHGVQQLGLPTGTARNKHTLPSLEDWRFPVDNDFAEDLAALLGQKSLAPTLSTPAKLCEPCSRLKIWEAGFSVAYESDKLQQDSKLCELCGLLWHAWSNASEELERNTVVNFERTGSTIHISGAASQVALSLLRSPDAFRLISGFQIGFPELPEPDSDVSRQIARQWLKDCDDHHSGCNFVGNSRLPTRLLYLGSEEKPTLRLLETTDGMSSDARYIALSHQWGDPSTNRLLFTHSSNLESFKQAIPQADVPQTFADAIAVTRRLGIQYLWIDALCIIQGPDGDFNTEAKRVGDVFSCAYCVIAASRASIEPEGFLHKPRLQRRFITIQQESEPPFYVCEPIDDFGRHVLEGALHTRGWVLQEHALARRTIFFTDSQMYFECGQGVRCETLTKMQSHITDFLGDPRFPEKAMKQKSRAIRIRIFQDLYRYYSKLLFTRIEDRPIAIAGLENRLFQAYATTGAYGIFDDGPGHGLFHRSLLWQRSEEEDDLLIIDFSSRPDSVAPSWSWMAYAGGIDYIDPPFQETEWERTEIEPPCSATGGGIHVSHNTSHLKVVVRSFSVAGASERSTGKIKFTYDTPNRKTTSERQSPLCVVVAKEKGDQSLQEKTHYVLVVIETGGDIEQGRECFSRLGVGFLPGKYIGLQEDGVRGILR